MSPLTLVSSEADAAAGTKKNKDTKRQLRKIVNPSNTWPQQPKIQSSDVRAKAYLRVAGLGESKTSEQELLDPTLDMNSPEMKFGRLLGGTNQRKRHETVKKLQMYLKARCDIHNEDGGISELDLMKLWKGLWFTLYMADKVPVQDELSKRLAELIWCVAGTEEEDEYAAQTYMTMCGEQDESGFGFNADEDVIMEEVVNTLDESSSDNDEEDDSQDDQELVDKDDEKEEQEEEENELQQDDWNVRHCRGAHLASLFVKTFFSTIQREWGKMDKHRVDKFYTLIRLMMQQIYRYMAIRHWNVGIIRLFNDVIFEEVLSKTPNGLRYHIIDLCMEELVHANATAPMPLTEATFLDCLEPFFAMVQSVQDALVQKRVMNKVLLKFLEEHSVVSQDHEDGLQENDLILDQVHVRSVAQFIFELASNKDTRDRYRKDLYEMHKTYAKRLKRVGRDVVLDDGSDVSFGMTVDEEDEGDADAILNLEQQDEPPIEVSKKKKKRKGRHNNEELKEEVDVEMGVDSELMKKKKKHRKITLEPEPEIVSPSNLDDENGSNRKKRKKKVKSKVADQEEEVVITCTEQKRAVKAAAAAAAAENKFSFHSQSKKQKKKLKMAQDEEMRRVSFGSFNRSKSHKASMRALKTTVPPSTSKNSPQQGILLKKGGTPNVVINKKRGRRHASDYF